MANDDLIWHKALDPDELPEGRATTVSCALKTLCMTRHEGTYAALDNRCPHQGGPLGEGSIEKGWLRCPWHGWDYHPTTGKSPGGFDDGLETFPVEERDDGIYVGLPPAPDHERTTTDVMAETFVNWGVRWVFGMVGHSNLGLADALRRQTLATADDPTRSLRYIGIRHEGAAAFAISAYGKLTGRPAAALTIAGPGATNLLTGLWDAHVDHAPAIALTGQVQTQVLGRFAFQEVDLKAAFGGVARWSATVQAHSNHAELANLAVKHAIVEEGPTHLVFPDDAQTLPSDQAAGSPRGRLVARDTMPTPEAIDEALTALRAAERPLIVVGHGARWHMDAVAALAERLRCPVVTTFKGKGLLADDHPLGCGVLGRSGTPVASWFMNEADLIVAIGTSFSNHTGITSKTRTIHLDRDPLALGNRHAIAHMVLGDLGRSCHALVDGLDRLPPAASHDHTAEVAERWAIWDEEKRRRLEETSDAGLSAAVIFDALTRTVPDDAVIAVDVGNNTYSFGRYFEPRGQAVLMSGYLGSIGFALPAAMGAWAATQEAGSPFEGRKVVSISGDGGLGQYLAELTTLAKYGMDITHVLLDNRELGKISKEQRAGEWDVWGTRLVNPDFAAFAASCGLHAVSVTDAAELEAALEAAIDHPGPAFVCIRQDALLV